MFVNEFFFSFSILAFTFATFAGGMFLLADGIRRLNAERRREARMRAVPVKGSATLVESRLSRRRIEAKEVTRVEPAA
jgi:hypothetical protein